MDTSRSDDPSYEQRAFVTGADSARLRWNSWLASLPPFPGKLRLVDLAAAIQQFIVGSEGKACLREGAEFRADLHDRIQKQMWCGCYAPHIMRALRRVLRTGDTFLDFGAHIGYHSYLAAGLVGSSGRVFAFEADPENFRRLEKNLKAFPFAKALQLAIWSREEKLKFARSESGRESGWGSLATISNAAGREQIEVEGVSLDAWCERAAVKAIRAIKMDIEGAEVAALRGAKRALQQTRPILLLEMNEPHLRRAGASALMA